ncbi:MAG: endonuclease MutS2 [Clostridiales bacterium]|nr:MAG: endonuclease MutS2 [Clostridiales bacterium]
MNKKVLKTLEYDKIIDMLVEEADSALGKDSARRLRPSSDHGEIVAMQAETSHALTRLFHHGALSFHGLTDIRPSLVPLAKGGTLGAGELLRIGALLEAAKRAVEFDKKDEETDFLSGRFDGLQTFPEIRREISRCILSEDEISDDASSELKRIRRAMKTTNDKIREQLSVTVNSSGDMLRDNIVTMRNGRYCLPVKQEYKSAFQGMIHDQSSTGSTFFIEPMAIVKLNNDLAELAMKEQEEIERILASISSICAPETEGLERDVILLAELDFIFAKAKLSKKMQGSEPIFDDNYIEIKKGRHPLIPRDRVVPIDVTLGKDYRLLIITGPNTGGKTVSLKTVGLFTLMGQAGLHIPAFDGSHLRVFHEVYADIGDEQSIEQSLSTFSSHMTNTVSILKHADKNTLALFDELGAGTDPVEGAALAISILDNLLQRNVTAMATTHYSELKIYALSTDHVENASCEFDVESLQPTYRLLIGVPGKSNAFAISSKLGISDEIIEKAKSLVDEDSKSFEDVVTGLESTRKELEQERAKAAAYREEIERQKKKLAEKNERIDKAKEKILRRANEEANEILQKAKDMADDSIRKYNKWMDGSKGNVSDMERQRSAIREQLKKTGEKLATKQKGNRPKTAPGKLSIGDLVMVHSMGVKGTVMSLPNTKGKCFVQMGIMRSEVNADDLELLEEETLQNRKEQLRERSGAGKIKMMKSLHVSSSINLIGKTVDEAIALLDKYLDDAYLAKLHQITIIHGVGTGALRNAVQAHLKKSKYIKTYRMGEYGEGGYGVTVAEFK